MKNVHNSQSLIVIDNSPFPESIDNAKNEHAITIMADLTMDYEYSSSITSPINFTLIILTMVFLVFNNVLLILYIATRRATMKKQKILKETSLLDTNIV